MDPQQIREAYIFVTHILLKCGSYAIHGFQSTTKNVTSNGGHWDLVTEYDCRVEDLLIKGLKQRFPHHRILGEENYSEADQREPLDNRPTWVIDPIDGTVNFIRGVKSFAISVALVVAKELKIGIVYNPCMDELYTTMAGQGAFLNNDRIRVSGTKDLEEALIGNESSIASLEVARPYVLARSEQLIKKCIGMRTLGSVALSLAYIASGKLDGCCIEYIKPWNVAAGTILIREAGGVVMNFNGNQYDIMRPDIVAASSVKLARQLLGIAKKVNDSVDRKKS